MQNLLLEAQYFPPVQFFMCYFNHPTIFLDPLERFEKQTYRNRCRILTAAKVQDLIVPVQKGKTQLTSGQVKVIYEEPWPTKHLRSMATAYGKAPYFEHYFHQIEALLAEQRDTIFDLNIATIRWAEKVLGIENRAIVRTEDLSEPYAKYHSQIHPKAHSKETFTPYFQCFDWAGFAPNLSVLDLVFNEGPVARAVLQNR